jgi:hypothetical protein
MSQNPDDAVFRLRLIRAVGCLAYPAGAAIVAALAFMILRIV